MLRHFFDRLRCRRLRSKSRTRLRAYWLPLPGSFSRLRQFFVDLGIRQKNGCRYSCGFQGLSTGKDTTFTYFEMDEWEDEEKDLKALGHSKYSRPDLSQIVIGLAVTRDGIPIRSWVWPGNTSDMSVIPEVKRDLTGWNLGRVVSVIDRGFSSEENLRMLQRTGGAWEVERAFRTLKTTLELRPVYHRKDDRICAHVLLCGLALLLVRLAEAEI
ncbi:hypothetical protein CEB3_c12930 [Peptococcaceae bacterium CEB3]|nr:hypothetical protein CEB3_c12930 [Peptococcaceae bacterium CEB3]